MRYYPAFLDLDRKPCLVVGGGAVAERKVETLLKSGARVTVVSPAITARLRSLASSGEITHARRGYHAGDIDGMALVVTAAGPRDVNRRVAEDAAAAGVLVNSVDDPANCSFVVPSIVERGGLTIAISTGGAAPALARRLRQELEEVCGPEYAVVVEIMGAVRRRLLRAGTGRADKDRALTALAASPLAELIRRGDRAGINRLLGSVAGPGTTLSRLGVRLGAAPAVKQSKKKETGNR